MWISPPVSISIVLASLTAILMAILIIKRKKISRVIRSNLDIQNYWRGSISKNEMHTFISIENYSV
tara:strand:- start:52 stop:249 length:198 start_codon:yes stop_codon:yes gene_type:complete